MKQALKSLLLLSSVCALVLTCSTVAKAQGSQFVYANDDINGANTVEFFKADTTTGVLTSQGAPIPTGGMGIGGGFYVSARASVQSKGGLLFISNAGDGSVSVFTINKTTGVPTLTAQGPVSTGGNGAGFGIGMALTPDGKFLFAGNGGTNNITSFSVGAGGQLTMMGLVNTTGSPDSIFVSRDGKYLLESEPNNFDIGVFAISGGTLTAVAGSPFFTSGAAAGIDSDCAGKHIFVGDASFTETIEVFTQDSNTGALTPIAGSPFNFPIQNANSNGVIVNQVGKFLYVSNQGIAEVTSFKINQTTGAVTGFTGNRARDGVFGSDSPSGLAISPLSATKANLVFTGDFSFNGARIGSLIESAGSGSGMLKEAKGGPFAAAAGSTPLSVAAYPTHVCH